MAPSVVFDRHRVSFFSIIRVLCVYFITSATKTTIVESNQTQSQTPDEANDTEGAVPDDEDFSQLDMSGRVMGSHYQVKSKLGAGSFGQVYLCEHLRTRVQWAMKVESRLITSNPQLTVEVNAFHLSSPKGSLRVSRLAQDLQRTPRCVGFS